MTISESPANSRKIFSVSELNREIKQILEKKYAFVWVSGEISNISKAASGHLYLTLKDRKAQISGVIFRSQTRLPGKELKNGMQVTGFGRVSVYEPRGTYQIILEYLEKSGVGELLAELEALKNKLRDEGLFAEEHKKTLPFLPSKIAVITSPTGAAIEDIIHITQRRFANISMEILPVSVQGENAAKEIVTAFELAEKRKSADVIVLARGGGSVEDLRPFNSEQVARAIFAATIPVVSAVGHETDYTISDFVADLRAPTPSAAAELIVPVKEELFLSVNAYRQRLDKRMEGMLEMTRSRITELSQRLVHPRKKVADAILRVDELEQRLIRVITAKLHQNRTQLNWWHDRMMAHRPDQTVKKLDEKVNGLMLRLEKISQQIMLGHHRRLQTAVSALKAMDPNAVLKRGYSITRRLPEKVVVRDADQVVGDAELEIILANGRLRVKNLP